MVQRRGKRLGIHTNATLRAYPFQEGVGHSNGFLIEDGCALSTSKKKRWQIADTCSNDYYNVRAQDTRRSIAYTHKVPPGMSGGQHAISWSGRSIERCTSATEPMLETCPLTRHAYPFGRQLHKNTEGPCKGCLYHSGRIWQLRGLGSKSRQKTKGMKKMRQRDNAFVMNT